MNQPKVDLSNKEKEFKRLEEVAYLLKIIAHPHRLRILKVLKEADAMSVAEILEKTEVERTSLSHHLTKMKDTGILKARHAGKTNFYQLINKKIFNLINHLQN